MSFNSRPIEEPQVLPVNDAVRIEHSSVGGQAGPQAVEVKSAMATGGIGDVVRRPERERLRLAKTARPQ